MKNGKIMVKNPIKTQIVKNKYRYYRYTVPKEIGEILDEKLRGYHKWLKAK